MFGLTLPRLWLYGLRNASFRGTRWRFRPPGVSTEPTQVHFVSLAPSHTTDSAAVWADRFRQRIQAGNDSDWFFGHWLAFVIAFCSWNGSSFNSRISSARRNDLPQS